MFFEKTKVLIYILAHNFYKNLIKFFIEGNGMNDYYKSFNNFIENDNNEGYNYYDINIQRKIGCLNYIESNLHKNENKKEILEDFKYKKNELYDEIK